MPSYKGLDVTDLVVVVPGILGSRLARDGKEVWGTGPRRLLVNIATFGRKVRSGLAIPADVDPDDPRDGVTATGLITELNTLPGVLGMDFYGGLRRSLRKDLQLADGQLVDFPYDWRLSCRINGARLTDFLDEQVEEYRKRSGRPDASAILVCHSMGGLVARWCVDKAGAGPLVSKVITIGTPHKGSMLALDAMANGVRLPRKIGADLSEMALSFPSLYELLPTYSCVHLDGSARRPLSDDAVATRVAALCPVDQHDVAARIRGGLAFHTELTAAAPTTGTGYELICFRGAEQPTPAVGVLGTTGLACTETVDGVEHGGDGVVPQNSGIPEFWSGHTGAAKHSRGKHSALPGGRRMLEELRVTLRHAGQTLSPAVEVSARAPSEVQAGEAFDVEMRAVVEQDGTVPQLSLAVSISPEESPNAAVLTVVAKKDGHTYRAHINGLAPGLYRMRIDRGNKRARDVDDLADSLVVYDEAAAT